MTTEITQKRFPRKHSKEFSMTPRERVIRALRRTGPDRVPACARFTPAMMRTFNENIGAGIYKTTDFFLRFLYYLFYQTILDNYCSVSGYVIMCSY